MSLLDEFSVRKMILNVNGDFHKNMAAIDVVLNILCEINSFQSTISSSERNKHNG